MGQTIRGRAGKGGETRKTLGREIPRDGEAVRKKMRRAKANLGEDEG